jgi:hypothetical protein
LAVSDASGKISILNHEGQSIWCKQSKGKEGWVAKIDENAVCIFGIQKFLNGTKVYHGHTEGVTKYSLIDGTELWHCNIIGGATYGILATNQLYISTDQKNIHCIAKHDGSTIKLYSAEFPTPSVFCCALSPGDCILSFNKLINLLYIL